MVSLLVCNPGINLGIYECEKYKEEINEKKEQKI